MQDMIYISEREYQEMKEQIVKLWECLKFQEMVMEKYKKLAAEALAKEARMRGEQGHDTGKL